MSKLLLEPGERYSVTIDVLGSTDGISYDRHRATAGEPVRGADSATCLVLVDDLCSMVIAIGENGFTIRKLKLLGARQVHVVATVAAGPAAPDWLPPESTYLIFDGDRTAASTFGERFFPLQGMADERSWQGEEVMPLDRLAVAVGRSVARANGNLLRIQGEAGAALLSQITVRMAVGKTELCQGRVLVTLARPGQDDGGQYVELTMTATPGEPVGTGGPGTPGTPGTSGTSGEPSGSGEPSRSAAPGAPAPPQNPTTFRSSTIEQEATSIRRKG